MGVKEVEEVGLVLLAETFEVQDFAEVGVGFVGDVDQVGLHEGFGGGGADLEGFEDGVEARHGLGDTFEVALGWGRGGGGG